MKIRPIDANALKEKLKNLLNDFDKAPTKKYVVRILLSMLGDETQTPTLDYEPVVHAHWSDANGKWKKCSNCFRSNQYYSKYCPWCGAKMDEEVKG